MGATTDSGHTHGNRTRERERVVGGGGGGGVGRSSGQEFSASSGSIRFINFDTLDKAALNDLTPKAARHWLVNLILRIEQLNRHDTRKAITDVCTNSLELTQILISMVCLFFGWLLNVPATY